MIDRGFLATLVAKPGKEQQLADFLNSALPLANAEPGTITWYAIRIDDTTFGIFDTFETQEAREAHINGPIAKALMDRADDLLAQPPTIQPVNVLASKTPG